MNCGRSWRGLKERARLKPTGKTFFVSEQHTLRNVWASR
jgi:hypothetical protein